MSTNTEIWRSVGHLPAQAIRLDPELSARIALSYGLALHRLLSPTGLRTRLAQIGVTGSEADAFVSLVAETERALDAF